jgi:hypothetical protein
MTYDQARAQINDGDVIAFRGSLKKPGNCLFAAVTSSRYTHTGTAFWLGDRLLLSEMKVGGNHFVFLSAYSPNDWDVYACTGDRAAVRAFILENGESHRPYDFGDLLALGARYLIGAKPVEDDDSAVVCSGLTWLECCAANPAWLRRTKVAPVEVANALGKPFLKYRGIHV